MHPETPFDATSTSSIEEPALAAGELRAAGAQGVKWSLAQTVGGMGARLAFTFVLVRLVGPANFGVIAQATLYTGLLSVVLDQGFGVALVQRKVLDRLDIGTVTWMNMATGLTLAGVTFVVAPTIAGFFHTEQLTTVLRVLSIDSFIASAQLVPKALLRRSMRFRTQTKIEILAVVVGGVVGVVAAVAGADYWALVVQTIVYDLIVLVCLHLVVGVHSFRGSWANLRSLWAFGAGLLGSRFLVFFGQNFDNVLIGRYESARQLAYYALSYRLLRMPMQMIGGVANIVSLPIFSRIQDDTERLRSWFLRSTSLVALASFPVLTLLVVGARDGVPAVFGEQWRPASTPLMILCVAGTSDVVRMLMAPVGQARARTDVLFWISLVTFGLLGVGFVIGVQFGIVGVATAYAVVTLGSLPVILAYFSRTVLPVSPRRYVASVAPAIVGSLSMAATWLLVDAALSASLDLDVLVRLAAATAVSAPVYLLAVRLVAPDALRSAREVGRLMITPDG